jgi:hypothetical protein
MTAMKLVALAQSVENSHDCLAPSATGKTSAMTQAALVETRADLLEDAAAMNLSTA